MRDDSGGCLGDGLNRQMRSQVYIYNFILNSRNQGPVLLGGLLDLVLVWKLQPESPKTLRLDSTR